MCFEIDAESDHKIEKRELEFKIAELQDKVQKRELEIQQAKTRSEESILKMQTLMQSVINDMGMR